MCARRTSKCFTASQLYSTVYCYDTGNPSPKGTWAQWKTPNSLCVCISTEVIDEAQIQSKKMNMISLVCPGDKNLQGPQQGKEVTFSCSFILTPFPTCEAQVSACPLANLGGLQIRCGATSLPTLAAFYRSLSGEHSQSILEIFLDKGSNLAELSCNGKMLHLTEVKRHYG